MKIEFIKMGINGEGIGYLNKKPVFCMGVFPNEIAEVTITEQNERFYRAELCSIIKPSQYRITPVSQAEYENGFPLMALHYEQQLIHKKELLEEALWKYGHVNRKLIRNIHHSENVLEYRSECKLPFGLHHSKLANGLYRPNSNHFVPIKHFATHTKDLETIRFQIMRILYNHGFQPYNQKKHLGLRYLIVRCIDQHAQCTLITGNDIISQNVIQKLAKIKGLDTICQSINTQKKPLCLFGTTKLLAGKEWMEFEWNHIHLQISASSFFQLNVSQAKNLYQMAIQKIDSCDTLVEAYCGIGTMSLLAHQKAKHIYAYETVHEAIQNAKENAHKNNIKNIHFECCDAAKGLQSLLKKKQVDTLLIDPPRSGLDEAMLNAILNSTIKKIIYISCNPSTLGKNLHILKKVYDICTVIPFDMFPCTAHVESLTVLERIGGK